MYMCHILQVQCWRSEEGREGGEGEGNGWRQGSSGKERLNTRDEQREGVGHSGKEQLFLGQGKTCVVTKNGTEESVNVSEMSLFQWLQELLFGVWGKKRC